MCRRSRNHIHDLVRGRFGAEDERSRHDGEPPEDAGHAPAAGGRFPRPNAQVAPARVDSDDHPSGSSGIELDHGSGTGGTSNAPRSDTCANKAVEGPVATGGCINPGGYVEILVSINAPGGTPNVSTGKLPQVR